MIYYNIFANALQESAAELTGKALMSATMGELNRENSPFYFEDKLTEFLQYATLWQAIVLLDEADVFLEQRQDGPGNAADRNALVAGISHHSRFKRYKL